MRILTLEGFCKEPKGTLFAEMTVNNNSEYFNSVLQIKNGYGEYSTCDEHGDNGLNGHQFRETNTKLHYIKDVYSKFHIVYPESIEKGE